MPHHARTRLAVGLSLTACLLTVLATVPAEAAAPATHAGLTWTVSANRPDGTVHVGSAPFSNPYVGDAAPGEWWPMLCLKVDGRTAPSWLTPTFFEGWAEGSVALTPAVPGYRLNSQSAADGICQATFGLGWHEAGIHDGRYGPNGEYTGNWTYWAAGSIPEGTRFWIGAPGHNCNPWS